MKKNGVEKFAPLSGAASVLALIISAGMLGIYEYLPQAERLLEVFNGNSIKLMLIGYLGLFSALLLMWFAGSIYVALKAQEGGDGRLSMVAFGGCVASAVSLAIGFTALIALGARIGAANGISAVAAVTLYDLYGTFLGQMAAFTFAALIGSTAAISLRTAMYPSWFGWASGIIAVGLISPIGYFVMALVLVWLAGVSISLYRRGA